MCDFENANRPTMSGTIGNQKNPKEICRTLFNLMGPSKTLRKLYGTLKNPKESQETQRNPMES